ncbi:cytochrome c peroxidase [Halovibrio sp. HP20-50]|uniref:cytochrome c peroxidase n=1 Tax=Halovibrio sp. HP20-59 TaxID=3080275 RepID=UPI00294AF27C|nr:cytochrome c peroxidase [Halovibrio sp. HP20-59]MEA2117061.1 cytochrome c peroxidase [Halovibrio sp. HP20-59]
MSLTKQKRSDLLDKLRRQVRYTAPVLMLVAGGVALGVSANEQNVFANDQSATSGLMLASNHAEAEAQPEGEASAEGEAEAEAEGEGEGEGEAEGEAQAEGADVEPNERTQLVSRPEGYVPGYDENGDNPKALIERGEALFNDPSLSTNGMSCASCHGSDGQQGYQATFNQPYPHPVAMGTNMFGMETVHADEMVQLCMVAPMAAEPLDWESEDLAALAAYVVNARQRFAGEADGHCNM